MICQTWPLSLTLSVGISGPRSPRSTIRLAFSRCAAGRPVRGMLKYDVSVPIDPGYLSSYEFDPWFDVTTMTIQNPRKGTEITFETDPNGDFADVNVFNGYSDENGPFDGIFAPQSIMAPAGFAGNGADRGCLPPGSADRFPPRR